MDKVTDSDRNHCFKDRFSEDDDPEQQPEWILGLNCMVKRSVLEEEDPQDNHADTPGLITGNHH